MRSSFVAKKQQNPIIHAGRFRCCRPTFRTQRWHRPTAFAFSSCELCEVLGWALQLDHGWFSCSPRLPFYGAPFEAMSIAKGSWDWCLVVRLVRFFQHITPQPEAGANTGSPSRMEKGIPAIWVCHHVFPHEKTHPSGQSLLAGGHKEVAKGLFSGDVPRISRSARPTVGGCLKMALENVY